jgi:hypothetical protein
VWCVSDSEGESEGESEVEENGKQQEEESTVLDARCQVLGAQGPDARAWRTGESLRRSNKWVKM